MSNWFDTVVCGGCGKDAVPYYGNELSKVIVIGAYPGQSELDEGIPMVGSMGSVLKSELHYLGVHLDNLRYGNLWQHLMNDNEKCFEYSVQKTIEELEDKELTLLLGKEPVEFFLNRKVTDVCGLFMKSGFFSGLMMACVNPAIVFQHDGVVGEMRLALKKFVRRCEEMKLI